MYSSFQMYLITSVNKEADTRRSYICESTLYHVDRLDKYYATIYNLEVIEMLS